MKKHLLVSFFSLFLIAGFAQDRYFYGVLSGANEVPANASVGGGVVIMKFNTNTKTLELFGNYTGLSANISGSHIHQAAAGANGGVVITLGNTAGNSGSLFGTGSLTAPQETALFANEMYVNVHTSTFPGGEIRGQLMSVAASDAVFSNARLQGAQEVPPNPSVATGKADVLLDKSTNTVYVTGVYGNLTTAVTGSHIHLGNAGSNGPVIVTLTNSGSSSGTLHAVGVLTDPNETALINAGTYINVHSSTYPGGEIRGQITTYSQQLFFGGRLSGANEVPANASVATGTVIMRYNADNNELELTADYQNLTASITGSHIHTGAAGVNGPVIVSLANTGSVSGGLYATAILTEPQEALLVSGGLYVNVHSGSFPSGEIRTQLNSTTPGQAQYTQVVITGSQEVPANATTASGIAAVLVDKITGQTYVTGAYSNLSGTITGAHLHRGLVGTNGPVILGLTYTGPTEGTVSGSGVLNPAQVDSFINGLTYINIHSNLFPGGEIRGQLANTVLPVKLKEFDGIKLKNFAVLTWKTSSEENLKQFEVEQQNTETGVWVYKSKVTANGNSAGQYKTDDVPLSFGQTYVNYRLKMVDKDGKFLYSKVVKINFTKVENGLVIVQNPITNSLNYRLSGLPENKKAQVTVMDQLGRSLYSTTVTPSGNQYINTSSFNSGIYMLKVQSGDEIFIQRFLKQ